MSVDPRLDEIRSLVPTTPALVFDERVLRAGIDLVREAVGGDASVLFAMKALSFAPVLELLAPHLDGLHASSLFEARLARSVLDDGQLVHLTTPGLREEELDEISDLVDLLSFNSLSQWRHVGLRAGVSSGLRLNPHVSFADDERYDPCCRFSKLGVPLDELAGEAAERLRGIEGVLVHCNCESKSFAQLIPTVAAIEEPLDLLPDVRWVNLGGGYLFGEAGDLPALRQAIALLRDRGLDVIFEPGTALVRRAGVLVATVVDLFRSDDDTIAILDTSLNHLPEPFEFGYQPDVVGHADDNPYPCRLAGCTCLAGDVFGDYAFAEPLRPGSRVVLPDAGAYSLVKATMFNGVNLPSVYLLTADGRLRLERRFDYDDFLSLNGGGHVRI